MSAPEPRAVVVKRVLGCLAALPLIVALKVVDRWFMTAVVTGDDLPSATPIDDAGIERNCRILAAELADPKKVAAWLGASS